MERAFQREIQSMSVSAPRRSLCKNLVFFGLCGHSRSALVLPRGGPLSEPPMRRQHVCPWPDSVEVSSDVAGLCIIVCDGASYLSIDAPRNHPCSRIRQKGCESAQKKWENRARRLSCFHTVAEKCGCRVDCATIDDASSSRKVCRQDRGAVLG